MKIARRCLWVCLIPLLLFSMATAVAARGKGVSDPHLPLDTFVATFDGDPGLPADSFSLTLGGVPFDFTFTGEGDGGNSQGFTHDAAHGEGDSPSVSLQSYGYNSSTVERVIIGRSDGYDFVFDDIYLNNRLGETVFVAAYDDGDQIGATQVVVKGASGTLDFGGIIVDALHLSSIDFDNTNIDSFAGDTTAEKDFGDLPASYGMTTAANGGANHVIGGPFLGNCVDSDLDGQPSANAGGDDVDGSGTTSGTCSQTNADEDGVTVASAWSDGVGGGAVEVTVSGGNACLSGWLDWDGDDNFSGSHDHIMDRVPLSAGDHTLTFDVPAGTFTTGSADRDLFARFRLLPDGGNAGDCGDDGPVSATGRAPGGEVEDYQWSFLPTSVGVRRFGAESASPARGAAALATLLLAGIGMSLFFRRWR